MDENVVYEFLNKSGVSSLSKAILTKVNSRITERIVSVIDENSDNNHVPSAAAVYSAISKMSHVKFKTLTGPITSIVQPNTSYIYLQRDNESDTTWMMYIFDEALGWINIGDTEVDLSNYWSKDAADVEALKIALGIPAEVEALENKIEAVDAKVDAVDAKVDVVDGKLDAAVEELKAMPANLLFNENGDFAISLRAKANMSLVDYMFTLKRPGMYTVYAERGCPGNPVSASNSSFRGIAHITQLEDTSKPSSASEYQKMYGWIMLFDQDGNTYVNYIRRSVASGWVANGGTEALDAAIAGMQVSIDAINAELATKVGEEQMVAYTTAELESAVEEAYTATAPTL